MKRWYYFEEGTYIQLNSAIFQKSGFDIVVQKGSLQETLLQSAREGTPQHRVYHAMKDTSKFSLSFQGMYNAMQEEK